MRLRSIFANLMLLAVTLLSCLGLVEVYLQISENRWERDRRLFANPPPVIQYHSFPTGLYALEPDQRGNHVTPCMDVQPISIDSQGFRGTTEEKKSEIVLLGDSFVEALQVPDGQTVADRLEAMLGRPVLNAGVSGYATTHEMQAWRERLAKKKPSLLVLFVYLGNDISGNSCALSKTAPPCGMIGSNGITYLHAQTQESAPVGRVGGSTERSDSKLEWRQYARSHLALYALAHDLRMVLGGLANELLGRVDRRWGLYEASAPVAWNDAWSITQDVLDRFNAETKSQGVRLVLVVVPEFIALAPDPKPLVIFGSGSAYPKDFDAGLPSRRLMEIAKKLNIPALDLLPVFTAYRDRFSLPSPYMSFSCDGHWNPLGHALAAEALANFLKEQGLAQGKTTNSTANTPAQTLLGDDTFQMIYRGGIYRPTVN